MSYTEQDVERVAEAIYDEYCSIYNIPILWEELTTDERQDSYRLARAALDAMEREPSLDALASDAVAEAGAKALWDRGRRASEPEWENLDNGVRHRYRDEAKSMRAAMLRAAATSAT